VSADNRTGKVWFAFPSANVDAIRETADLWTDHGCHVVVLSEADIEDQIRVNIDRFVKVDQYSGWPTSHNIMMRIIRETCPDMRVVIAGSDDIEPDPDLTSDVIHEDMEEHFGSDLFGVMNPTGDRFSEIDLHAVCPWIGRGFIERSYQGQGPFFEQYYHLYSDTELQQVAEQHGVFWQRRDVRQLHKHHCREGYVDRLDSARRLKIQKRLNDDKRIFEHRQKNGFPGSGVIE